MPTGSEVFPFLHPTWQTGLHPRAAPGVVGGLVAGFLKLVLALCPAQASFKPSSGLSFGSHLQVSWPVNPVLFSQVRGVLALLSCSPPPSHYVNLSRWRGVTCEAAFGRPFSSLHPPRRKEPTLEVVRAAMA